MTESQSVFSPTLEGTLRHALAYLGNLDHAPVAAAADLATLRGQLAKPLGANGLPPEQVIDELVRDVAGGIVGSAGGRFFGWVIGGTVPAALGADWLTSTWDQNASVYACSPAAAVVEEVAGEWLKDLLGIPDSASFALVTGAQMAHVTGLAAARDALLARRGWDVEERGLYGAPPIRLICAQRHSTYDRALRLLGLGLQQIRVIGVDAEGRMNPAALESELRLHPDEPVIVHLQAGDINTGSFDAFETLIPLAHCYGAWAHVDGAFGLWMAASPRLRHLTRGMEAADSWVGDGHKWLNVPYDCGYAFVAGGESNRAAHRSAMSQASPYVAASNAARDAMNWTPEWSRRARGFATYAAIRQLGRAGIAGLIERCCDHTLAIVDGLAELPGVEVLARPTINQGMVRFMPGDGNADSRTEEVIAAILRTGEAFFTPTTWHGMRAMRISVCNWQTSASDVERAVRACRTALQVP
jgi:glutamate/tyrosine decarboxylase-like PLP-dependent enzyme